MAPPRPPVPGAPPPPGAPKVQGVPGIPGNPAGATAAAVNLVPRQPEITLKADSVFKELYRWNRICCIPSEDLKVANRTLTVIDKKATFNDEGSLKEFIWKNNIKINQDINEEWCLKYFFEKKK
jgi:hypothetical protein